MDTHASTVEPKCPSCRGLILRKIDQNARFPYKCAECGLEFLTLPASSTNFTEKIFEAISGKNTKIEGGD
jgi:DNA-directed RNA polymerase subunit RPC12/RpoP